MTVRRTSFRIPGFGLFAIVLLALGATEAIAQADSLADMFPLRVGNSWTFHSSSDGGDFGDSWANSSDTTTITLIFAEVFQDSVVWSVRRSNSGTTCWTTIGNPPSCQAHALVDTFRLTEELSTLHRLYRRSPAESIWSEILPLGNGPADSIPVFRYAPIDSAGYTVSTSPLLNNTTVFHYFVITLRRNLGPASIEAQLDPRITGLKEHVVHSLGASTILDVHPPDPGAVPSALGLDQNFPNPFNPTTSVTFRLPNEGFARLRAFDVLGREVALLAEDVFPPGTHTVVWKAAELPSGTYFLRLESAGMTVTRPTLLLR